MTVDLMDYDYDGEMDFFQKQLTAAGISPAECDMTRFCGCTFRQLQGIVDVMIAKKKAQK